MHNALPTKRQALVTILVAALMLSGCESTSNWLKGRRTAEATDPVLTSGSEADTYLVELEQLVSGDPATQAEIYADAESAAKLTPGPSTRLRYALVMATPGHSGSNPASAQTILREVLSQPEMLTESEAALASIFLRNAESNVVLGAEARRLRAENTRAATTEEAAISQRIASVEAENRQLRQALEEAESKLDAVTSIERSIRAQSEENDPR